MKNSCITRSEPLAFLVIIILLDQLAQGWAQATIGALTTSVSRSLIPGFSLSYIQAHDFLVKLDSPLAVELDGFMGSLLLMLCLGFWLHLPAPVRSGQLAMLAASAALSGNASNILAYFRWGYSVQYVVVTPLNIPMSLADIALLGGTMLLVLLVVREQHTLVRCKALQLR